MPNLPSQHGVAHGFHSVWRLSPPSNDKLPTQNASSTNQKEKGKTDERIRDISHQSICNRLRFTVDVNGGRLLFFYFSWLDDGKYFDVTRDG